MTELVDALYAERYPTPTPLHPITVHGPAAVCQASCCHLRAVLAIQITGLGTRSACALHVDQVLDDLGVIGQAAAQLARLGP